MSSRQMNFSSQELGLIPQEDGVRPENSIEIEFDQSNDSSFEVSLNGIDDSLPELGETATKVNHQGRRRIQGSVSFGPKNDHVAYYRQTSGLEDSMIIDFDKVNVSEDDDFEAPKKAGRKKDKRQSQGFRTAFASERKTHVHDTFRVSKNPTQMKLERIEAFLYNKGMEIALGSLFIALNVVAAAHGAYQFSERGGWIAPNKVLAVTLPIARAGGRLVTLNCAILLLTACKYLWTQIRTYVAPVVPIGFPIDDVMPKYHRYVALSIIFSGCIIHTLPQIVNYASRSITMDHEGIRMWTFGDGFATKQLLITGTLLAIIFSTFFLTTLQAFRKTAAGFRWFWTLHITGIATAYPLLLIHGTLRGHPIFLYFAALPLALYIFDVFMRRRNIYSAEVLRWRVHDDDGQQITELVLKRPKGFSYTPGQYAELKFLPISTREWHPFTIASSPGGGENKNDEVVLYIKNAGRWTGALMDYAAAFDLSKQRSPTEMLIRGPHGAPAMNYDEYKHILVIGSGVGVTPLLSIWNHLLDEGEQLGAWLMKQEDEDEAGNADETIEKKDEKETRLSMMSRAESIKMERAISRRTSMNVYNKSRDIFNDRSQSQRFLTKFMSSRDLFSPSALAPGDLFGSAGVSGDLFGSYGVSSGFDNFEASHLSNDGTAKQPSLDFRSRCIIFARILESMMISMPIFVLFIFGETMSICFHFAGWYMAANAIGASLSLIALMVHGSEAIMWTIVAGRIYFRLFKGWLECAIVFANCNALWWSIRGCMMAREGQIDAEITDFRAALLSMGCVIVFQAIRIFHIFYMTLKVETSHHVDKNENQDTQENEDAQENEDMQEKGPGFRSVDGIVINRKYSNMKFAARCILPRILQHEMSDVFSMQFYGTREKPKIQDDDEEKGEHSLVGKMMGSTESFDVKNSLYYKRASQTGVRQDDFFCAGRPDWNNIFLKAIAKAHATNEEGESVGVFFCGAPAIAHALQLEARKVTAQHQFAMKVLHGKGCRCKIIVHAENF